MAFLSTLGLSTQFTIPSPIIFIWNGLNIDIDQDNINRFKTQRPRDINLCVAVGNNNETMKFFNLPGTPRTTILSNLANDYEKRGWRVNEKIVSVRTISSIIDHYEISEIDFLKIDVEGAEEIVLQGGDWKRHRPKIILVEATFPETDIENHFSWESILLSSDYKFAFFDGLNRYYVSAEQSELLHKINQPANFFDNFLRNDTFILAKAVSQNMSRRLD